MPDKESKSVFDLISESSLKTEKKNEKQLLPARCISPCHGRGPCTRLLAAIYMIIKPKLAVPIIVGISLGLLVGTTSIFGILFLAVISGFIILCLYTIVFTDNKTEGRKSDTGVLNFLGMTSIGLVCAVIVSIAAINFLTYLKQLQAERIVPIIETYYKTHSAYPKRISDLQNIDESAILNLNYRTDSARQSFYLSYSVNGSYSKIYSSEEKSWTSDVY